MKILGENSLQPAKKSQIDYTTLCRNYKFAVLCKEIYPLFRKGCGIAVLMQKKGTGSNRGQFIQKK